MNMLSKSKRLYPADLAVDFFFLVVDQGSTAFLTPKSVLQDVYMEAPNAKEGTRDRKIWVTEDAHTSIFKP